MSNNNYCDHYLATTADPPPMYSYAVRCIITIVLAFIPILCIASNVVVVMAIVTHRQLRTRTNLFVVSLAFADMCVAILVMPFQIYEQYTNKSWYLGETICLITISFDVMMCTVSIFHLTCIAIDRYLIIGRPLNQLTLQIAIAMVVGCWVLPIFISFIPIMNKWNTIGIEDMLSCILPPAEVCAFFVNIEFAIICSCIAFYIPVVFIGVCNWKIFLIARKHYRQIQSLTPEAATSHHREHKATKTLGIIMGCFSICWFPFFILNIIDPLIGYKINYDLWLVALWLGYTNSTMNPFLFYNFNTKFRNAIRRLFKGKAFGPKTDDDDLSKTIDD